mmetsp:Transcript_7666/g.21479  ORF Transcript_7666/g.21479 Transcript_7666/m.21479 type:complete len:214 (+) Transcript_7666:2026-2667(+)
MPTICVLTYIVCAALCQPRGTLGLSYVPILASSSFSSLSLPYDHSVSDSTTGTLVYLASFSSSPVIRKELSTNDLCASLVAAYWCESMSVRRTTIMPGAVLKLWGSASSMPKGASVSMPCAGPRKTRTMALCRRNCEYHFAASFRLRGSSSASSSGLPAMCTTASLRWVMSKPMYSTCGSMACPTCVMYWSSLMMDRPSTRASSSRPDSSSAM